MLKKFINCIKVYEYKFDLLWFVLFPLFNIVYFIANNIHKKGYDFTIALDRQLPFIPLFILPYIYWYVYMFLGYAFISVYDRNEYIKGMLGLFIGMWISYLIYFVFPTEMTRPMITEGGFLNSIIKIIYSSDRPFNCFPSLHVLGTYFVMRKTKKEYNYKLFVYTQIVGVLIILSTLFIKQHFIVDAVISIVLVEIILVITNKIKDERIERILNIPYVIWAKLVKKYKELLVN